MVTNLEGTIGLLCSPSPYNDGMSGLQTGQGGGGGFELWNNNTPSMSDCDKPGTPPCAIVPAMLGPSGEPLTSPLCTDCASCPCTHL